MTRAQVNQLGTDYQNAIETWGEHNQITVRAFIAYTEAKTAYERAATKRKLARLAKNQSMKDCGLVKVRGNLGGTYWE